MSQKPVYVDKINDILAPDLDRLEACVMPNGYNADALTDMRGLKPERCGPFSPDICRPNGHRNCMTI